MFFNGGVVRRIELSGLISLRALVDTARRCVSYGAAIILVGRIFGCSRC